MTLPGDPVSRTAVWDGPSTLFEALEAQAASNPDHEAVAGDVGHLTYAGWRAAALRVAASLKAGGVRAGDVVALIGDNRPEWLEVAMGVAALGARLAPINTWSTQREIKYFLDHARPRVLVTIDRLGDTNIVSHLAKCVPEIISITDPWPPAQYPGLMEVVVIGDDVPPHAISYERWCQTGGNFDAGIPSINPCSTAMVLYTSGSTAVPKAVCQTHRALLENGFYIGERQGLTSEDRVFLAAPLFWSYGGANALMSVLTHSATLVLQSRFSAAEALDLIETEACTAIYTLPAMTHALVEESSFSPRRVASLVRGLTIGAPAEVRLVADRLSVGGICNIYGSTEVYGNCCVTPFDAPLDRRLVSQGPPLPGVEIQVVDPESRQVLPTGEIGEMEVRGRVTPGYLTATGSVEAVVDAAGWFHTKDLGSLDDDGWLTFHGRASEVIKTAGINVSPLEVEKVLANHSDVEEVAVVGGDHPIRGEEVVAFVRLSEGGTATPAELRLYCREQLASYKVPTLILVVDELPATSTGKIARRTLKLEAARAVRTTNNEE